jgi:hypothetical protein
LPSQPSLGVALAASGVVGISFEYVRMRMTGQWSALTPSDATQSLPPVPPIHVAQSTFPSLEILMTPASHLPKWFPPPWGVFWKAFANHPAGRTYLLSTK